jgi:hypothetical protein
MKKYILSIVTFAIIFIFVSCDKEELSMDTSQTIKETDILTFATLEDFEKTLEKVNSMTKEERLAWEKENNFSSFGTISEQYYEILKLNDYKTIDQLKNNSDEKLINIYKEAGDFYIEPSEFSSRYKYVMNKDKMYIISNRVFKIIDSKPYSANLTEYKMLKSIENVNDYTSVFIFDSNNQKSGLFKVKYLEERDSSIVGSSGGNGYKTKVAIQTENFWASFPTRTQIETEFTIYNYKLGWLGYYIYEMQTEYEINLYASDEVSGKVCNCFGAASNHNISSYNKSEKNDIADGWSNSYNPVFDDYDVFVLTAAGQINLTK